MVGNLIEICWLKEAHQTSFKRYMRKNTEGYGFIAFEISNSSISTVFHEANFNKYYFNEYLAQGYYFNKYYFIAFEISTATTSKVSPPTCGASE